MKLLGESSGSVNVTGGERGARLFTLYMNDTCLFARELQNVIGLYTNVIYRNEGSLHSKG